MADTHTLELPKLGRSGDTCEQCGAPLATDQRYCLACGERRSGARVPYEELLGRQEAAAESPEPPRRRPGRDWTPVLALGGLALLALVLVIGVLIGKGGSNKVASGPPQIIRLGGGTAATDSGTGTAQNASFTSDWPSGKKGYTVEIGELAKSGTNPAAVQAAKAQAQAKGAQQVGALDSDSYSSLPGGNYVIYSGAYDKKPQADAALAKLKSKFPQAKVVQVSDSGGGGNLNNLNGKNSATLNKGQLQQLNNLKGNDYSKQSRKLPQTLALPGAPPPKDNQAPGGGSGGGQTIK